MNIAPISFAAFKGQKDTGSKWGHDGKNYGNNGPGWKNPNYAENDPKRGINGPGWDRERHERDSYEKNSSDRH